jgi:hypothetical protein
MRNMTPEESKMFAEFVRSEMATGESLNMHPGMSLRDWFAGQADVAIYEPLQTLKAKLSRQPTISELATYVAEIRTIEADAMLAAREGK